MRPSKRSPVRLVLILDSTFFMKLNSCSQRYCQILILTRHVFSWLDFLSNRVSQHYKKCTRVAQSTSAGHRLRTLDLAVNVSPLSHSYVEILQWMHLLNSAVNKVSTTNLSGYLQLDIKKEKVRIAKAVRILSRPNYETIFNILVLFYSKTTSLSK
jgi:hypothetical protein